MKKITIAICTILMLLVGFPVSAKADSIPEPRSGHSMVEFNGNLYVFGGQGQETKCGQRLAMGGPLFDDLWEFNVDNSEWEGIDFVNDPPPARQGHAAVVYNDKMYVFFGQGESGDLSDIWTYDFSTKTWEQQTYEPPARVNHTATVVNNDILIFGGRTSDNSQTFGDAWSYDPTTGNWEQKASIFGGKERYGHSAIPCDNMLYVYGGAKDGVYYDDMWVYLVTGDFWSSFTPQGDPPPARKYPATAYKDYSWWIFGGEGSYLKDTWEFDISTNAWTQKSDGPVRSQAAAASVYLSKNNYFSKGQDVVYLFGGLDSDGNQTNDLWKYDPSTDAWEEIFVGIEETEDANSKEQNSKLKAFPNPFLKYISIYGTENQVEIYDFSGSLVETTNKGIWNGKDAHGNEVESGIYFLKSKGCKPVKVVKLR